MMKAAAVLFLAVTALSQTVQAAFTANDIAVMQFALNLGELPFIGHMNNTYFALPEAMIPISCMSDHLKSVMIPRQNASRLSTTPGPRSATVSTRHCELVDPAVREDRKHFSALPPRLLLVILPWMRLLT